MPAEVKSIISAIDKAKAELDRYICCYNTLNLCFGGEIAFVALLFVSLRLFPIACSHDVDYEV